MLKTGRQFVLLLALFALCLPVFAAYAQEKKDPPLLPPRMDYGTVCKVVKPPLPDRDWSQDAGGLAKLPTKQAYELGVLYLNGTGDIATNPDLAAKFLTLAAGRKDDKHSVNGAKYHLAKLYLWGKGVTQDPKKAHALLEDAVNAGVRGAATELGNLFEEEGQPKKAEEYYIRDLKTGNPNAALALTHFYLEGKVVPPSENADEEMFLLAQNMLLKDLAKGRCDALYQIGSIYMDGIVVARNEVVGTQWLKASSEAGKPWAMQMLARQYQRGVGVPYDMEQAAAWWRKAAGFGVEEAMYELGINHALGTGLKQDIDLGLKWLEKAASRGHLPAMEQVAKFYRGEYGGKPNPQRYVYWLEQAALHPKAGADITYDLALAYAEGYGVKRDPQKAFQLFQEGAKSGSRDSIRQLGKAYRLGLGVKQNPTKALRFYRLAADRGSTQAMMAMVEIYRDGIGVEHDPAKAERWLDRAVAAGSSAALIDRSEVLAAKGTPDDFTKSMEYLDQAIEEEDDRKAMIVKGLRFEQGRGVEKSSREAEKWFNAALEPGRDSNHLEAMALLGRHYLDGEGVEQDTKKGLQLLQQARANGYINAAYTMGKFYLEGGKDTKPDFAKALMLIEEGAEKGDDRAMRRLADMYQKGEGVPANAQNALRWYFRAVEQGSVDSARKIGKLYKKGGEGVPAEREKAIYWFEKAAVLGDIDSMIELGKVYGSDGNPETIGRVVAYYTRAAQAGSAQAMRELAALHMQGNGMKRDPVRAIEWYKKAAEQGDNKAMVELAQAYAAGLGVKESADEALLWWKKAAAAGNETARQHLSFAESHGYGDTKSHR